MSPSLKIFDKEISIDSPAYFIAEIGSNFDGSLSKAKALIDLAAESNADAVKFQHYTARSLVSQQGFSSLPGPVGHQSEWDGSVYEVYDRASLNVDWTSELSEHAHSKGLAFITSPYSVDLLELTAPFIDAIKIGSGDITYHQLIEKSTTFHLPVLLATGASTLDEVCEASSIINSSDVPFCLMQCNTNYQSALGDAQYQNLSSLQSFKALFPSAVLGLSCHAPYDLSVLLSLAMGARVIEKHFTDSNQNPGPDHGFALDPAAFKEMVERTRFAEEILGHGIKKVEFNEIDTRTVQRRAVRANRALKAGTKLSSSDFSYLRPCPPNAFPPYKESELIGRILKHDMIDGEAITDSALVEND